MITEFTDCFWEGNGLLDFDRRPKAYRDFLRAFNTQDVLVPELRRPAIVDGQAAEVRVDASHFAERNWSGAVLSVQSGAHQTSVAVEDIPRGEVRPVSKLDLATVPVDRATIQTLDLRLTGRDGTTLAENRASALVLPAWAMRASYTDPIVVVSRKHAWEDHPS